MDERRWTTDSRSAICNLKSEIQSGAIYPDDDAVYVETHVIDAPALELTVACPHAVDNTRRLVRVGIGPLVLGDLQPGQWREITEDEQRRSMAALKMDRG
jgi:hypothetical protein